MSSEGFKGVPGVPDGWELVAIRLPKQGEMFLNVRGEPQNASYEGDQIWPIIRKIETPKQFRPFANGAEYIQKRQDGVAVDWKSNAAYTGFFAVVSANAPFVWVAFGKDVEVFDWQQAFERLVFRHIDGSTSPFGAEVAE